MSHFRSLLVRPVAILALATQLAVAEQVSTVLTKVADLPVLGSGPYAASESPQSPRGGILQIGNELWFTTNAGGAYTVGSISTYNLETGVFELKHSFGLLDPLDPATAKHDGYAPFKTTLELGNDGRIYYTTQWGGANWNGGTNGTLNNGGVVGSFDPATVQTTGVKVHWNGGAASPNPRSVMNGTIYVPRAGGEASLYAITNAGGGEGAFGTVQKIDLDASGNTAAVTQLTTFTSTNGKLPQGGLLYVDDPADAYYGNMYFATPSYKADGTINPTLQTFNINTNQVSVLYDDWDSLGVSTSGFGYNTPVYDPLREVLYVVSLKDGIYQWDLQTSTASKLPNSGSGTVNDGGGNNFADPILFGDSLYYVTQTDEGYLYRYDLELQQVFKLYDLKDYDAFASGQSGSLSVVVEDGIEYIYFLTGGKVNTTEDNLGSLFRLQVSAIPEPSIALLVAGTGVFFALRRRRVS